MSHARAAGQKRQRQSDQRHHLSAFQTHPSPTPGDLNCNKKTAAFSGLYKDAAGDISAFQRQTDVKACVYQAAGAALSPPQFQSTLEVSLAAQQRRSAAAGTEKRQAGKRSSGLE